MVVQSTGCITRRPWMAIPVPDHLPPFFVLGKKTTLQRQIFSASFCYLTQAVGKLGPVSNLEKPYALSAMQVPSHPCSHEVPCKSEELLS